LPSSDFGNCMMTLKKAIIILSLINPRFSKGGGEGELLLSKGGLRRLFLPPMAEAYTYQDVENAYNNAVAQYPNDKIWIEEFEQNGKKGYKIWKRPKPGSN